MKRMTRSGVTLLELLMVISVMAIIATMAIGAVLKSVKQGREKKIDVMITTLQMALENYHAKENKWPFQLSENKRDGDNYKWTGTSNKDAFKGLFDSDNQMTYVPDSASLMTVVGGTRMNVKQAQEEGRSDFPLGYVDPDDTTKFNYFTVMYYPLTERVKITK